MQKTKPASRPRRVCPEREDRVNRMSAAIIKQLDHIENIHPSMDMISRIERIKKTFQDLLTLTSTNKTHP